MKILINHAGSGIAQCINNLEEATRLLTEAEDSPYFKGNLVAVRDRIDELKSILDDLSNIQEYIDNIELNF